MNYNPDHPYVRGLVGCGHGVLFTDYCRDCAVACVQEQYTAAVRTVQRLRNELRKLGAPLPGETIIRSHKTPKTWPFPNTDEDALL